MSHVLSEIPRIERIVSNRFVRVTSAALLLGLLGLMSTNSQAIRVVYGYSDVNAGAGSNCDGSSNDGSWIDPMTFDRSLQTDFNLEYYPYSPDTSYDIPIIDDSVASDWSSFDVPIDTSADSVARDWSFSDPSSDPSSDWSSSDWSSSNPSSDSSSSDWSSFDAPIDNSGSDWSASGDFSSGDSGGGDNVGDPVNAATGNKFEVQTDYVGVGPLPLVFRRTYNSLYQTNLNPSIGTLGNGWRSFYSRSVSLTTKNGNTIAVVARPDGKNYPFTRTNGAWVGSGDVTATLVSVNDANNNVIGWIYTLPNDNVETYDANGRLLGIANRAGLVQTLLYDANGRLASIMDPFGRTLQFAYDMQNRLVTLTGPAGQAFAYGYDSNSNLVSVTYPDGTTRQYRYEDSRFPTALTGLIDENGTRFATWSYDGQERAVSSTLAGGAANVSITYNSDGSISDTDALGTTRTRTFTVFNSRAKLTGITVRCPTCATVLNAISYDANGLVASRTDFNGNVTTYTHDAKGRLTSLTRAAGTPLAQTTLIDWHPQFHLPTVITTSTHVTHFTCVCRREPYQSI